MELIKIINEIKQLADGPEEPLLIGAIAALLKCKLEQTEESRAVALSSLLPLIAKWIEFSPSDFTAFMSARNLMEELEQLKKDL